MTTTTVQDVFDEHRDLLIALMDRTPRRGELDDFLPILTILDVYAEDISDLDKITHQPDVSFAISR